MRELLKTCLCLVLAFNVSHCLFAQSSEVELNQAELMKQWIGTWEMEIGEDSVSIMTVTSFNNGLYFTQEEKADGNPYQTWKGFLGLSDDKEMIISSALTLNGVTFFDLGKFVEKNKYIADRYFGNLTHAASQLMIEFAPESITARFKWRGQGMMWPEEWGPAMTFKKID
jgi:hypothetical protein